MATTVRIATFNCENLFARFKFNAGIDPATISASGWEIDKTKFEVNRPEARKITGMAVKATKADVVAFQEVENLDVLKRFRADYLGGFKEFPHAVLIEGNDPRLIDVAVLSRLPIEHVRTYHHVKESPTKRSFVFSRDCLEVDVRAGNKVITLFVNHLKSMLGGRAQTRARRELQAKTVKQIVTDRFGAAAGGERFVILGDLNDYMTTDASGPPGIGDIVNWNQVENVIERLPAADRWTHYFAGGNDYKQLDYILASQALTPAIQSVEIVRKGLPKKAVKYTGPRFPGVGEKEPKASDHCPVVMVLSL